MPAFEPGNFLASLHRLYEQQVKQDEQIAHLTEQTAQLAEQTEQLIEQTGLLVEHAKQTDTRLDKLIAVVGDLVGIVRSHENRLERLEGPA